ncbi:MAG: hypothetical protein RPU61_01850 [Candidatus Sedimenticola sp. (ex Thyasira tokunagai)]
MVEEIIFRVEEIISYTTTWTIQYGTSSMKRFIMVAPNNSPIMNMIIEKWSDLTVEVIFTNNEVYFFLKTRLRDVCEQDGGHIYESDKLFRHHIFSQENFIVLLFCIFLTKFAELVLKYLK